MHYTTTLLAVLGLGNVGTAHMIMAKPVPYGKSSLNNSPLAGDGSDFPCKQRSGVYEAEGASNEMVLGGSQEVSFIGSAVHGGGSCQFSITYDKAPTKSSKFKVIHSIEGGCPQQGVSGNAGENANQADPSTYNFTIPESLPTGDATFAWTWFNKVGNREMYMNCAPATLKAGGSSKRSPEIEARDQAAFDALPDMLVANIPTSECQSVDSADLEFPDPGDSLEKLGTSTPTPPTGPSCGAAKAAASGSSSSGSSSGSGAGSSASSVTTSAPVVSASAASGSGSGSSADAGSGSAGTFQTSAIASSASAAPVVASSTVSAAAPAGTGSSSSGSSSSSAGAMTGACTTEGMWNCIAGSSFQQCASGQWSAVQQMAPGTACGGGQSMNLSIARRAGRRSFRFRA